MTKKIMICGGGSGGHIFPGIAACHALAERNIAFEWLGCAGGMEEQLIPASGIKLHLVQFEKPGGGIGATARALLKAKDAAKEAAGYISDSGANAVLGMGGYPSLPGVLAAVSMKLPRLIHEQNAKLGWANLALIKLTNRAMVTYPDTTSNYAYRTGLPLRPEFANVPPPEQRFAGRSGGLRILVLGGSQGASSLNTKVPAALAGMDTRPERIVHQAGAGKAGEATAAYE
ncbi:MAG: glycosyltransferase, partial [Betaproteobacteria bacterium]|nr:glycosyltransferase [Betaproteobacteria bacterium]